MKIHLLDMGQTRYGDCIVITNNNRSILIDGGHPGDAASIRFQLSKIFKKRPPFNFDLLVVTHCHSDHIGCLPELVALGDITAGKALVADEYMGFGLARGQDNAFMQDASDATRSLFVALQEEDHSALPDADMEQFLFDAARLVDKYTGMLDSLQNNGTAIQRYPGDDWSWVDAFHEEFKDMGLQILGPTSEHLVLCTDAIAKSVNNDAINIPAGDAEMTYPALVKRYRATVQQLTPRSDDPTADRPGIGAAKNNQSIVLSVQAGGWKALLAGDMQFGKAEVTGLGPIMNTLLNEINKKGPFDFIKLTHHTSYNGINERILTEWLKTTKNFAHTGGVKDPSHPDPAVLSLLKKYSRELNLARTDRNGMITISRKNGELVMEVERAGLKDFSENLLAGDVAITENRKEVAVQIQEPPVQQSPIIEPGSDGMIKVTAEIPHTSTRVTITVDIDPKKKTNELTSDAPVQPKPPGAASRLAGLLFVTSREKLAANIGRQQVQGISAFISTIPGAQLVDIGNATNYEDASVFTRQLLQTGRYKGVVIMGGYDIVPPQRLRAIDDAMLDELRKIGKEDYDADGFIIWSDDIYGDADGDKLANYPVSRMPDAKDATLVMAQFQSPAFSNGARFGVRNYNRIFAEHCFDLIPGRDKLEISEVFSPVSTVQHANQCAVYYMLHGSEIDGTRFWGEKKGGRFYEALDIKNLPHGSPGNIIFSGACWGGLITDMPAYKAEPARPMQHRSPKNSIALAYLEKGVLAYIGCTGSHYSPIRAPWDTFGKPLHDHFWRGIAENLPPAKALFEAKKLYINEMPHGLTGMLDRAVEVKIVREFACFGLGW